MATSLKAIIKNVVENLSTACVYLEGKKQFQNLDADSQATFPITYLDLPLTCNHTITASNRVQDVWSVTLAFLEKGTLDELPSDLLTASATMRLLANEFVKTINERTEATNVKTFLPVKEYETQDLDGVFDAHLNGVLLTIDLEPLQSGSIC